MFAPGCCWLAGAGLAQLPGGSAATVVTVLLSRTAASRA